MIERRILLASVAGLFGLAAFRWLRTTPAQAAEKFEVEKTDAEWRAQLTPQQYEILRKQGTERAFCLTGASSTSPQGSIPECRYDTMAQCQESAKGQATARCAPNPKMTGTK